MALIAALALSTLEISRSTTHGIAGASKRTRWGKSGPLAVKGLQIPRNFLLLYPAGPKPLGIPGAFRQLALDFRYSPPK
jgi:hypothetical protein